MFHFILFRKPLRVSSHEIKVVGVVTADIQVIAGAVKVALRAIVWPVNVHLQAEAGKARGDHLLDHHMAAVGENTAVRPVVHRQVDL